MLRIFPVLLLTPLISLGSVKCQLFDWRESMIECAKLESLSPNLIVRNLAILSIGSFEILNLKEDKYQHYLSRSLSRPEKLDVASALRGYSLNITQSLHPLRSAKFRRLAHHHSIISGKVGHTPSFKFGEKLALLFLSLRSDDGATTRITYIPKTIPGHWRRTPHAMRPPELPHWPMVAPFCLPNIESFLPPPPPDFDSPAYVEAVKEVKLFGGRNSPLRTKEQSEIAQFWKDFSYSSTPPGRWNEIAQQISESRNLSPLEDARLFALLNATLADAGIVAWATKYKYQLWRPIHAIRLAADFQSTQRLVGNNWEPLLETPPHPDYISGHGCYSGAAASVLQFFFGSDKISFVVSASDPKKENRKFTSLQSCASEIGKSRLWGGIHYQFSNDQALLTGKKIAQYTCEKLFYPRQI